MAVIACKVIEARCAGPIGQDGNFKSQVIGRCFDCEPAIVAGVNAALNHGAGGMGDQLEGDKGELILKFSSRRVVVENGVVIVKKH